MINQAYEGNEQEICGILAGQYDENHTLVTKIYPAENVSEMPEVRYMIGSEDQFDITESIENEGLEVAGFYHSHPAGPTHPSETDEERATWPGLSYVITALDGYPYVGSWRWRADTHSFDQELVRVSDDLDISARE